MAEFTEALAYEIDCGCCVKNCNPWVKIVCATCNKQYWCKVRRAQRWCATCLQRELEVSRILLLTGHETPDSERYYISKAAWYEIVHQQGQKIVIAGLECGRANLVPESWTVSDEKWEVVKQRCKKRFAWKLKGKRGCW